VVSYSVAIIESGAMSFIGYARVSTADQDLEPQHRALRAAGCSEVVTETGSGADRARPALAALLLRRGPGDTLVVVRVDRLARSLRHLLEVMETLATRGVAFRSLGDPIDTAGPSGTLILQILGAVAEFERALGRERTLAGLAAARARGRVGGNPGLKRLDPAMLARLGSARRAAALSRALPHAEEWVPLVRRLRPDAAWPVVVARVNAALPSHRRPFTRSRLIRLARRFVVEGLLPADVLEPARARRRPGQASRRAISAVAPMRPWPSSATP
jgi:DNA invertase Pin-like site-specific DNA recombinase